MTRFVVCGETLIDLVRSPDQTDGSSFRSNWLALSAGGPMNSAVALGKLGSDSHFLGRISTDAFGQQLRQHITDSGVALDLAVESEDPTSIAVVSVDEEGIPSYTFHFNGTANFNWQDDELPTLGADDWLHIASLSCVVSPGSEVLLRWLADVPCGISYDINIRPTVITDSTDYWARVLPYLQVIGKLGGVIKASDEDLAFLTRSTAGLGGTSGDPVDLMAMWVERFGFKLAVLTLGPKGGVVIERDGTQTRVPGVPTTVVDTVGAGDTFMAGFLDSYVRRGLDLETCLRRATAGASIVCSRRGPQVPNAAEVDAKLAEVAAAAV